MRVAELESLIGTEWNNLTIDGVFAKVNREKSYGGSKTTNKNQIYRVMPIELEDPQDDSKRVKLTLFDIAIDIFKQVKPTRFLHVIFAFPYGNFLEI